MPRSLLNLLAEVWWDESGQTLVEYAACVSLIALGILGVITTISSSVRATIEAISNKLL